MSFGCEGAGVRNRLAIVVRQKVPVSRPSTVMAHSGPVERALWQGVSSRHVPAPDDSSTEPAASADALARAAEPQAVGRRKVKLRGDKSDRGRAMNRLTVVFMLALAGGSPTPYPWGPNGWARVATRRAERQTTRPRNPGRFQPRGSPVAERPRSSPPHPSFNRCSERGSERDLAESAALCLAVGLSRGKGRRHACTAAWFAGFPFKRVSQPCVRGVSER